MSDLPGAPPPQERLTRGTRLRLAAALVALAAGSAALVIAILLVRSTLS
jgi:hypothetical protein